MNSDELMFFSNAPENIPAYEKLREAVLAAWPETNIIVQKTQIAFANKHRFGFASLRGRRLVISFGLGYRVESPRITQAVEPYPGRWTHHVPVRSADEIDLELLRWIALANEYAARK